MLKVYAAKKLKSDFNSVIPNENLTLDMKNLTFEKS